MCWVHVFVAYVCVASHLPTFVCPMQSFLSAPKKTRDCEVLRNTKEAIELALRKLSCNTMAGDWWWSQNLLVTVRK